MWRCKECGGQVLAVTQDIHERGYYINEDMTNVGACMEYRDFDKSYVFKCWNCGNTNKNDFYFIKEEEDED